MALLPVIVFHMYTHPLISESCRVWHHSSTNDLTQKAVRRESTENQCQTPLPLLHQLCHICAE